MGLLFGSVRRTPRAEVGLDRALALWYVVPCPRCCQGASGSTSGPRSRTRRMVPVEVRFDNKVCVVTGSARGIGYAIADELVQSGGKVVMIDILATGSPTPPPSSPTKGEVKAYPHLGLGAQPRPHVEVAQELRALTALDGHLGALDGPSRRVPAAVSAMRTSSCTPLGIRGYLCGAGAALEVEDVAVEGPLLLLAGLGELDGVVLAAPGDLLPAGHHAPLSSRTISLHLGARRSRGRCSEGLPGGRHGTTSAQRAAGPLPGRGSGPAGSRSRRRGVAPGRATRRSLQRDVPEVDVPDVRGGR